MSTAADNYKPTARLRFIERLPPADPIDGPAGGPARRILQQFWGPEAPAYMRDDSVGEWRDVPLVESHP